MTGFSAGRFEEKREIWEIRILGLLVFCLVSLISRTCVSEDTSCFVAVNLVSSDH